MARPRAIRGPADSHLPWREPFGRASRVQMCSRHIGLRASQDKLAGSDHSAGSGMGRTTFARRATSREGRCQFGQPMAGPKGKPHGLALALPRPAGVQGRTPRTCGRSRRRSLTRGLHKSLARGARPASNSRAAKGSFLFERTSAMKTLYPQSGNTLLSRILHTRRNAIRNRC
jgi:hypothetical protein